MYVGRIASWASCAPLAFVLYCLTFEYSGPKLSQMKFFLPLAVTLVFAFLTIRLDDQTVLDFISRGFRYFVSAQQYYEWREQSVGKRIPLGKESEKV